MTLKKGLIFFTILFYNNYAFAQVKETEQLFDIVEIMPEFIGGEQAMYNYLSNHILFPREISADSTFTGDTVYIDFIINRKGEIKRAKIKEAICMPCAKEALRVVKNMPKWKPGMQKGRAVKVYYTLPVLFMSAQ